MMQTKSFDTYMSVWNALARMGKGLGRYFIEAIGMVTLARKPLNLCGDGFGFIC